VSTTVTSLPGLGDEVDCDGDHPDDSNDPDAETYDHKQLECCETSLRFHDVQNLRLTLPLEWVVPDSLIPNRQ
jgi:hypothetical protein